MELRLGDKDGALHRSCHDDKDSEETEAEGMESAVGICRLEKKRFVECVESAVGICRFVKKQRQKVWKVLSVYVG